MPLRIFRIVVFQPFVFHNPTHLPSVLYPGLPPQSTFINMLEHFSKRNAYLIVTLVSAYFFLFGGTQDAFEHAAFATRMFSEKFPVAYDAILTVMGLYVVWRSFKAVFWFWYRLVVTTLKVTLGFSLVLIVFTVYLRGMERFFSKDLPLVYQMCWTNRALFTEKIVGGITSLSSLLTRMILDNPSFSSPHEWTNKNSGQFKFMEAQYEQFKRPAKQFVFEQYHKLKENVQSEWAKGSSAGAFKQFFEKL